MDRTGTPAPEPFAHPSANPREDSRLDFVSRSLVVRSTEPSAKGTSQSARKPRCRVLDRYRNQCQNPQLTEFGLCLRHLREAADEWQRIKDEARAMFPGLARILDHDDE